MTVKTEKVFVPLAVEPMLLTDKQAAKTLNISIAHFRNLDNSGQIPKSVRLGKSVRWSTAELREFVAARCPDRIAWQQRCRQRQESSAN